MTGTSGNDTINATGSTFSTSDVINGGAGTDTLHIIDTVGVMNTTRAAATVTNVENMVVETLGRLGDVTGGSGAVSAVQQLDQIVFDTINDNTAAGVTYDVTWNGATITTAPRDNTATAAEIATIVSGAINALAGATVASVYNGTVLITAPTAGTALPAYEVVSSDVDDVILADTLRDNVEAAASTATTAATYDISGIALESFTATATDVIDLKAKATTELTLTGTGAITVNGGGGDSTFTSAAAAVSIGGTTTIANGFTSVTVKGTSTTVGITDNSGLAADGLTVATGSTLTSASITGNTSLATVTGKGVNNVSMAKSSGGLTVTNANDHALTLGLSGVTAGTVTDATATSVAITTSASTLAATSNTLTGLTVAKAASLSIDGTKAVDLGTIDATKLATVTVSGTGGVTANISSAGATTTAGYVTSVDTTGSTAALSAANGTTANNFTIGTSTAFTGGAGQDNVTVGASTKALALGAGSDKLVLSAALATGGTADGGEGTDTLETTLAIAATAGSSSGTLNAKISNFEKLSVTGVTMGANTAIDYGYLSQVNNYTKLGAMAGSYTLTLSNFANGGTVEVAGNNSATAIAVGVANAAYGTADSLNIVLTSDDAVRTGGTVTAVGVETVNVTTNNLATDLVANSTLDTLTLSGSTGLKNVVIAGNAGLNMTNTETTIVSVDASGITGTAAQPNAFTWTSGALTNTAKTVSVVGTAAGVNTINLDAITDTLMVSTISVGGSANVSANVFTGGAGVDNVTGGAGADSFTMKEGKDVITTGAGADKITFGTAAADRDTVTDFTAGTSGDKIILASYDASTDYAVVTTRASAYTVALVDSTATNVIEFALEGNSTVNLGDNSANSLTGANLLKALNDGETAATLTLSGTNVADADLGYVVAYQNGNAYVYLASVVSAGTTVTADELTLVGILQDVALGAITSANFAAS